MPSATYGFLGNPKALTIINTATTYTIPAGEYAYVTVACRGGGSIKLDTNTVLQSDAWSVLTKDTGNLWSSGTAASSFLNTSSGTANTPVFSTDTAEITSTASYWVPTGTVIETVPSSGSASAVIQRFNA